MAVKLAKHYGADEEQAALAALLHDAAKEISKDEMRAIMQAHPEYAEGGEARPTPVWHGVCASILARTEWGVTDEAVLSAIACHTTRQGGHDPAGTRSCIWTDMTSAERDWPGVWKAAQAGNEGLGRSHAGGAEADERFCAVPGQTLRPRKQEPPRGYLGPQRAEWGKPDAD